MARRLIAIEQVTPYQVQAAGEAAMKLSSNTEIELRDLFAMAALVAASGSAFQPDEESAKKAFQLADAMLAERERRQEYGATRKAR
jgi:hypothetical protein